MVVKSCRYSQKEKNSLLLLFLLIPGMRLRETLLHFTVNTINPDVGTEMIDLNLKKIMFRVSI